MTDTRTDAEAGAEAVAETGAEAVAEADADGGLPTLPAVRSCPFAPPDEYLRLRDAGRAVRVRMPTGSTAWALTRHADVRAVLGDPRFSSDRRLPQYPFFAPTQPSAHAPARISLIGMDPPEHSRARRAVVGEFTVKRLEALQPRVQQIVDEHVDRMLAGPRPVDLVEALALPVPSMVICELLGVPYADHDFFQTRSGLLLSRVPTVEERNQARGELWGYLGRLIDAKAAAEDPGDDLMGRQIARQKAESGGVDREALIALGFLLLVAGHETTANMISLGVMALLSRPDQLAALRADPSRTPAAVEEMLRIFTIAEFVNARVATEDVELAGVLIREGEGVVALSSVADHDPEVFPEPAALDFDRGARHHLAFGFGIHQCLGQNLARQELRTVFDTLIRRVPGLRLAVDPDELPYKDDAHVYGLHELPVTWD
nr:cytochrome P450 [Phaeacidiphilus oryzae]